ncbi:hypothetical protein D3C73_1195960 [compost metagenome]
MNTSVPSSTKLNISRNIEINMVAAIKRRNMRIIPSTLACLLHLQFISQSSDREKMDRFGGIELDFFAYPPDMDH